MTDKNQNGSESAGTTLQHYGIKGMRWGVRRTPAQLAKNRGEKRVKDKASTDSEAAGQLKARVKANSGDLSSLSNQELKDLNERMNLEKNYTTLKNTPKHKSEGRKFAEGIVRELAKESIKNAVKSNTRNLVGYITGEKVAQGLKEWDWKKESTS